MNSITHIDEETITMLREVMDDGFAPLLQSYIDDSQNRLQELRVAVAANDAEQVRRLAHSLKGSSGNVGVLQMAELCLSVEQKGRDGQLDGVENLLDQIDQEYEHVVNIMQGYIQT